ncbi:hypothetical protein ABZ783_07025 [Micromonospora sp. NPDC047738]|uniref:hypothetical protein n=1 Tax=Micromonospora sp. NPDC047738 TaxID=3155741 RepID=UPI0033DA18BF
MEHRTDPAQVEHPRWCLKGNICRVDGIHHSKPLAATTGDAHDAVRVWLEQAWQLPDPSVVLESTVDGEVGYVYLPISQARVLRHQLGRLLDAAKGGAR